MIGIRKKDWRNPYKSYVVNVNENTGQISWLGAGLPATHEIMCLDTQEMHDVMKLNDLSQYHILDTEQGIEI